MIRRYCKWWSSSRYHLSEWCSVLGSAVLRHSIPARTHTRCHLCSTAAPGEHVVELGVIPLHPSTEHLQRWGVGSLTMPVMLLRLSMLLGHAGEQPLLVWSSTMLSMSVHRPYVWCRGQARQPGWSQKRRTPRCGPVVGRVPPTTHASRPCPGKLEGSPL